MTNSCGRCGATWTGPTLAHCSTCHVTFTAESGFDRHRRGGECVDPAEIGMVARTRVDGATVWGKPGPVDPSSLFTGGAT